MSRSRAGDRDHAQDDCDDEARPCPECSTVLMLTRIGSGASRLELLRQLHGWCPFCEWEGWLDG